MLPHVAEGERVMPNEPKLPDLLAPGLALVICGSAAGSRSAAMRLPYAGPNNKFWRILHDAGFTPVRLSPSRYRDLLSYGIGLTDMAKFYAGGDAGIRRVDDDPAALRLKIEGLRPRALAFNGVRAARAFLKRTPTYGRQAEVIGPTAMFALPSTAGPASWRWDEAPWRELAAFLRGG
jgi:double-stranded uracil-DNA glycosylase